jgi:cytochrome c553
MLKPEYIESALRSYRDGNRDHPTMNAQGMSLTEDDIEHLSAWFGQEPAVSGVADKASIAGLDAAATCIECHGASPSGATPDTPVLAGQYEDYLIEAIDQYRDGSRSGSVMPGFVASLDDDDIEAIADFYASQDGLDTLDEDD